jgi:hypothetical protein
MIGAGQRPATAAGSLHNANFRINTRNPANNADRAGQEGAVGADRKRQVRVRLQGPLAELTVRGEVVRPAQPVVIDPGYVGDAGVKVVPKAPIRTTQPSL